jgi:hypothetical protein
VKNCQPPTARVATGSRYFQKKMNPLMHQKRPQQAVERQALGHQPDRLVGYEEEVAIVKDENGKGRKKAQDLQPEELVGFLAGKRFRNRWR